MALYSCYYLLFFIIFSLAQAMETDLFALVRAGNLPLLNEAFTAQHNPTLFAQCSDEDGNTLLHVVTDARIAAFLLTCNVPVNAVNSLQSTPLHTLLWDTTHTDFDSIAVLLDGGADLTALNNNKQNPAHLVASKDPEFIHRLLSYVPRCAIRARMKSERMKMVDTLLLSLSKSDVKLYSQIPKEVKKMLLEYCLLPPYQSTCEHELVNALLFEKLDIISSALSAHDNLNHTPASLEQRYSTVDRSRLLDPIRVHKLVPDIIASIRRVVKLTLSYSLEENLLTSAQLPSTVPRVPVLDPE